MIALPNSNPKVLLTGFDAFGGDEINPSWLAVHALNGQIIAGHTLVSAQLPTVFGASSHELYRLIRLHHPALVICTGVASGRQAVSLERVAINVQDARIPDNAGAQPVDRYVINDGPAAYFSTLPIKAILQALTQQGLGAEVSQTAGTFVCNDVFYALMHKLKKQRSKTPVRGGFIHVPNLPSQGEPCMELADTTRALRVAVECALTTTRDVDLGGGSLS